jgi:two-component system response regulator
VTDDRPGPQLAAHDEVAEIVVVENDPHDAELIARALRAHQARNRVHWVGNVSAVFDYVLRSQLSRNRLPDLIVLDVPPQSASALEALRLFKTDPRTQAIPVVVLASSGHDRCVAESYRLGANCCVVKPAQAEAFVESLAQTTSYWVHVSRSPLRSA